MRAVRRMQGVLTGPVIPALIAFGSLVLGSCAKDADRERPAVSTLSASLVVQGKNIFYDRRFGPRPVACADCHADYAENRIRAARNIKPGGAVLGAHRRISAWGGEFTGKALRRYGAGAARCVLRYQGRGRSYDDALSQSESSALLAYFRAVSTGDEPRRVSWTALNRPVDSLRLADALNEALRRRGDPERGGDLFDRACRRCHATGNPAAGPDLRLRLFDARTVARLAWTGRGAMPFFPPDKLSPGDVADLLAFLQTIMKRPR